MSLPDWPDNCKLCCLSNKFSYRVLIEAILQLTSVFENNMNPDSDGAATSNNLVKSFARCKRLAVKLMKNQSEEKVSRQRINTPTPQKTIHQLRQNVKSYKEECESLTSKYITLSHRYEECLTDYIKIKKELKEKTAYSEEKISQTCRDCPTSPTAHAHTEYNNYAGVKQFHYKSDNSNSLAHTVNTGRNNDPASHLDEILQSIDFSMRQQQQNMDVHQSTSIHTSQNGVQLGEASSMVVDAFAVQEIPSTNKDTSRIQATTPVTNAPVSSSTTANGVFPSLSIDNNSEESSDVMAKYVADDVDRSDDLLAGGLKFVCFVAQHCYVCSTNHKSDEHLRAHFREKHPDIEPNRYVCGICNKGFSEGAVIKHHLLDHSREERLSLVEKMKETLSEAGPRLRIGMPLRVLKCPDCHRHFVKLSSLKSHMKGSHQPDNKQYLCPICGHLSGFVQAARQHEKTHMESRNFHCPDCSMAFKTLNSLRIHQQKHSGVLHSCDVCGATFKWKRGLTKHMRIHIGEKPYACKLCDKRFAQSSSLKHHERMHAKGVYSPDGVKVNSRLKKSSSAVMPATSLFNGMNFAHYHHSSLYQ